MSLITRLLDWAGSRDMPSDEATAALEPDERLAAAALLVHVARVDGRFARVEQKRLIGLIGDRFGLTSSHAQRLVARADEAAAADGIASLVERLGRETAVEERRRLLGLAYTVAAADGRMHEFEEDLVWRVGHLLDFDDAEIAAVRDEAVPPSAAPDR